MIIPLMKKKQWTKYNNIFMIKNSQRNRKREEFSQFDKEHLKKKNKQKKPITIQLTLYLMVKD